MPHLSSKTSREKLQKQTETVHYLLAVLKSMDKNNGPPLCTLLHEENINLSSVLETLMKLSRNDASKQRICDLGGLQVIADLLKRSSRPTENASSLDGPAETRCHACTLLANLSFGSIENKKLLISIDGLIPALLEQLKCSSEELQGMSASVLRNLSCNADEASKKVLRNAGIISAVMTSAMKAEEELTLEYLLLVLWNVSGHHEENKKDICEYPGSLQFIISLLFHKSSTIVEIGGGILKNISSYIAVHEHLRQILRQNECFAVLLQHLQSANIKIINNACGTLWNLSARCVEDQHTLLELGAVALLGQLVTSDNEAISMASSGALKNLVIFRISSASNNFNSEFERIEGKKPTTLVSCNEVRQLRVVDIPRTVDNLKQSVCGFEESLDEPIDYSTRYKEFPEHPHVWQKSNVDRISAYRPLSYEEVGLSGPKRNHSKKFNMLPNMSPISKVMVPAKINGVTMTTDIALTPSHLRNLYQEYSSLSPPEHPKHYCTEDTPDGHSVCRGSVNNISDFDSLNMEPYRGIDPSQIISSEKDLNASTVREPKSIIRESLIGRESDPMHAIRFINSSIYKDSRSSSPKEILKHYCTEDTPDGISRGSSLSSLSTKSLENCDQRKFNERAIEPTIGLPRINEDETLNIAPHVPKNSSPAVGKGANKSCAQEGAAVVYGTKVVTFDETPLMFSRCSSLASLNSFDTHSVHSSLVSEYSRRASSVVSPSELPNSPGDTPPGPKHQKAEEEGCSCGAGDESKDDDLKCLPVAYSGIAEDDKKNASDCSLSDNEDENEEDMLNQLMQTAMPKDEKHQETSKRVGNRSATMHAPSMKPLYMKSSMYAKPCFQNPIADVANDNSFRDTTKTYAVEGTPLELSRFTSLSNLTMDETEKVCQRSGSYNQFARYGSKKAVSELLACEDSLHAYCTEQTPIAFSRNDSLSSLSSKESPAKMNFAVHPKLEHFMNAIGATSSFQPNRVFPTNLTSTPSGKQPPGVQVGFSQELPIAVRNLEENDHRPCKDSGINEEADSSSSSSSSFSCSSDESSDGLHSLDQCIEMGMPKCKGGRRSLFTSREKRSVGCSKRAEDVCHTQARSSKPERSYHSEDDDTEVNNTVNNTVIYRGPQEIPFEEKKQEEEEKKFQRVDEDVLTDATDSEIKSHVEDLTDLIDDFYNKTSLVELETSRFPLGNSQTAEVSLELSSMSQIELGTFNNSMKAAMSNDTSDKKSRNKVIDFFKRYSFKNKKALRKTSPLRGESQKKFGLSALKKSSRKKHHKHD